MSTPAVLYAALVTRLRTITTISVYEGTVPTVPPADADGRVYPYAVAWPGPGGPLGETSLDELAHGMSWASQVTVAAGDIARCLQAVALVRTAQVGGPEGILPHTKYRLSEAGEFEAVS